MAGSMEMTVGSMARGIHLIGDDIVRLRALLGLVLFSLLALTLSTTSALAQTGQCRGGANNGQTCTSDADCPGACRANLEHPICDATTPCPNVCQGGDTPGAVCADGLCPGVCIGGDNAGAACLKLHAPPCSGGGQCSARCGRDQCGRAFCRFRTAAELIQPEPEATDDDADSDAVACLAN